YRLEHLTVDKVTRIVEYMKDSEKDKHDEDLRTYKEALNRNETGLPNGRRWHDYFTAAVKEAEKLNKAIRHMDMEDLRIILVLVISTCLGAEDVLAVFSFKKNGHPDKWATHLPRVFKKEDRATQLPTRAKVYVEIYWPDWWQSIADISTAEKEKWIKYAAKVVENWYRAKARVSEREYWKYLKKHAPQIANREASSWPEIEPEISEQYPIECLDQFLNPSLTDLLLLNL
ncbi:MAG: hypothetical protein Q9218_008176, partial [Villophora microphyllina]